MVFVSNTVIAGRSLALTDDLRSSRVEDRHSDDGLDIVLSFEGVVFSA